MHERGGEVEPPLHAAGVGADAAIEGVAEVDEGAQLRDPQLDLRCRESVEAALEAQQLEAGLLRVECDVLERDTDPQAHLLGLGGDLVARHGRLAAARREQRAEHPDGRGLAGAVGSEEAVDLAGADLEVETVDCDDVAERAAQATGRDRAAAGGRGDRAVLGVLGVGGCLGVHGGHPSGNCGQNLAA